MSQPLDLADDHARAALKAMSAEIQAAFAVNRAMLQALASLSPTLNQAAGGALDDELHDARRQAAAPRVVELIQDARERIHDAPQDVAMMGVLERALIAAADALPDIHDLEAAEISAMARG